MVGTNFMLFFHEIQWNFHKGHLSNLSNKDTSARFQVNKDRMLFPPEKEDTSLMRTLSLVPVVSVFKEVQF